MLREVNKTFGDSGNEEKPIGSVGRRMFIFEIRISRQGLLEDETG